MFRPIGVPKRFAELRHSKVKYKFIFCKASSPSSPRSLLKVPTDRPVTDRLVTNDSETNGSVTNGSVSDTFEGKASRYKRKRFNVLNNCILVTRDPNHLRIARNPPSGF